MTDWLVKTTETLSHNSGGQKAEMEVSAGLVPSKGCEGGSVTRSGVLLAIFGVPWLVDTSSWFLGEMSSHAFLFPFG